MWRIYAQTIQQVAKEEEEEDTPLNDMWHNARVWVDFLLGTINYTLCS